MHRSSAGLPPTTRMNGVDPCGWAFGAAAPGAVACVPPPLNRPLKMLPLGTVNGVPCCVADGVAEDAGAGWEPPLP